MPAATGPNLGTMEYGRIVCAGCYIGDMEYERIPSLPTVGWPWPVKNISARVGGSWLAVEKVWVRVGGAWVEANVSAKISGTWTAIHEK